MNKACSRLKLRYILPISVRLVSVSGGGAGGLLFSRGGGGSFSGQGR
jgi:hypothetical protein